MAKTPGYKLVSTVDTNYDPAKAAAGLQQQFAKYGKDGIAAIVAEEASITLAALQAAKQAGVKTGNGGATACW